MWLIDSEQVTINAVTAHIRSVGQVVKTPLFHGKDMGSIPVQITKLYWLSFTYEFIN